jgi:hypothetical protein
MNIEMNPTPAVIEEIKIDPEVTCTAEESEARLSLCKSCENFFIDVDKHTKCRSSGCNISLMITYRFKECPLEKW